MKRTNRLIILAVIATAATVIAVGTAVAHENEGFLYGKITTRSGSEYQGQIRWGDEETFWDDLFHSYKESRPYEDYLEEHGVEGREEMIEIDAELEDIEVEMEKFDEEIEALADRLEDLEMEVDDAESPKQRKQLAEERAELAERIAEIATKKVDVALKRAEQQYDKQNIWNFGPDKTLSILGGKLKINWNDWSTGSRIFISRFGDIKKIEVIGSEDAELTMRTGKTYVVSGYSNDVGGKISIRDDSIGKVQLVWKNIRTIEFMETPASIDPDAFRLHGTLYTDNGEYTGFIQWDSQECLSTDELDGDSEDGRMAIPMGNIKSIERRSRGSAWVEMKDGRRLQLEGTNDVDQSIRGILVEDPRFGRAKVPWDAFDKVVFDKPGGSGKGYADYNPYELKGAVKDTDGNTYSGAIVFDLDESASWEMLNGNVFDIEYDIPFANVESIRPRSQNASEVKLRSGETIRLEEGQDVSEANDGILIFTNGKDTEPTYVAWERVERIDFTK